MKIKILLSDETNMLMSIEKSRLKSIEGLSLITRGHATIPEYDQRIHTNRGRKIRHGPYWEEERGETPEAQQN